MLRDTALGAYYCCYGDRPALCVNTGRGLHRRKRRRPRLRQPVRDRQRHQVRRGRLLRGMAVFSVHASAPLIAEHEFGHSFAGLADEYEDAYPGYPACSGDCPEPNATLKTDPRRNQVEPLDPRSHPGPHPRGRGLHRRCRAVWRGPLPDQRGLPSQGDCMMRSLGPALLRGVPRGGGDLGLQHGQSDRPGRPRPLRSPYRLHIRRCSRSPTPCPALTPWPSPGRWMARPGPPR